MTQNVQSEYNEQEVFVRNGINAAVAKYHHDSDSRGWWDEEFLEVLRHHDIKMYEKALIYICGTKIAFIHSEVSEGLEGMRKNKMDDHIPTRKSIEVELADALIRIFDLAGKLKLDLGNAVIEKGRYNVSRPDHDPKTRKDFGGKAI